MCHHVITLSSKISQALSGVWQKSIILNKRFSTSLSSYNAIFKNFTSSLRSLTGINNSQKTFYKFIIIILNVSMFLQRILHVIIKLFLHYQNFQCSIRVLHESQINSSQNVQCSKWVLHEITNVLFFLLL